MREPCACGWEDCGHFQCSGCGLTLIMPISDAARHVVFCEQVEADTRRWAAAWIIAGCPSTD